MKDGSYKCPHCASDARRIRRRLLDRIISVLVPVNRYKCHYCQWHGNVSKQQLIRLKAAN